MRRFRPNKTGDLRSDSFASLLAFGRSRRYRTVQFPGFRTAALLLRSAPVPRFSSINKATDRRLSLLCSSRCRSSSLIGSRRAAEEQIVPVHRDPSCDCCDPVGNARALATAEFRRGRETIDLRSVKYHVKIRDEFDLTLYRLEHANNHESGATIIDRPFSRASALWPVSSSALSPQSALRSGRFFLRLWALPLVASRPMPRTCYSAPNVCRWRPNALGEANLNAADVRPTGLGAGIDKDRQDFTVEPWRVNSPFSVLAGRTRVRK